MDSAPPTPPIRSVWLSPPWWAAAALYVALAVPSAFAKPAWFDEWFTIRLAALDPGDLWAALAAATDLNPPGVYLLAKPFLAVGLPGPLAARVPSLLGGLVLLGGVYLVVARRCGPAAGAVAALVPLVTAALPYAYEGRPYAVVLGCCAAGLAFWQATANGRRFAPVGLAACVALGVGTHYYAVFAVGPLALGELVRTASRRRIDWRVWLALAVGVLPLAGMWPLVSAQRQYAGLFGPPDWSFAQESYRVLFGRTVVPGLASLALLAAWPAGPRREERAAPPLHEVAAAAGFLALPVIGLVQAKLLGSSFHERYAMPAVVGAAVLAGFAVHRATAYAPRAWLAVAVPLGVWAAVVGGWDVLQLRAARADLARAGDWVREPELAGLRVLTADPLVHPTWSHYAPADVKPRAAYALDPATESRFFGEKRYSIEGALTALERRTGSLGLVPVEEVLAAGRPVLVYGDPERGRTVPNLLTRGWRLTRLRGSGATALYRVDPPGP